MQTYREEDFMPMATGMNTYRCGCERKGPLTVCKIKYVDEKGIQRTVCYRQQCQECGFTRKNNMGKVLYWSYKDDIKSFNYLPEYFWAPEEVTYDENMQYSKNKKLDFIKRILILANKNKNKKGHLEFTKDEIYKLDLTNI